MISILTPTRSRPENVKRLVSSIFATANNPNEIEILFYVDEDDFTFPIEMESENVRVIRGPRMWLSLMQNILFSQCRGEIIMYAGDDVVFKTHGWDTSVIEAFNKFPDKLVLVYPNDLATHGAKIALHGFLHRRWVETVGYWVAPGRGSLYDLWHTEVARHLGRLHYLNDVHVAHIHYRQGNKQAKYDEVYAYVSTSNRSWSPWKTYRRLNRERRIDVILLQEKMSGTYPRELKYFLGDWLSERTEFFGLQSLDKRRLKTLTNFEFFHVVMSNILKLMFRKRSFK
jgi:hypothetical protein